MTPVANDEGWQVVPPSFRFDITAEVDLIEEIARVHGYGAIPELAGKAQLHLGAVPADRTSLDRIRDLLVDRDYQEAVTYSFIARESDGQFSATEGIRLVTETVPGVRSVSLGIWIGIGSRIGSTPR